MPRGRGVLITLNRESVLVRNTLSAFRLLRCHVASSISNTRNEGPVKNKIAMALLERILEAARAGKKFKVSAVCGGDNRRSLIRGYRSDALGRRRLSRGSRIRGRHQE